MQDITAGGNRPWEELIPDALTLIFKKIPFQEILTVIPRVCKSWRKVAIQPDCWQEINIEDWCRRCKPENTDRMVRMLVSRSRGSMRKLEVSGLRNDTIFAFIARHAHSLQILRIPMSDVTDTVTIQVAPKLATITHLDISCCKKMTSSSLEALGTPGPLSPLLLSDAGLSISRQWILPPLFQSHSYSSKHLFVRKYSWNPLRREAAKAKVARSSLQQFPGSEDMDSFAELVSQAPTAVNGVVSRVEGLLYTIADAASVATNAATATGTETTVEKQDGGWLGGLTDALELILKVLKDGLQAVHVPYAYGFAIILLTILVKGATFPLTQKQVESTMAMKNLEPKIKAIQQQYAGNQEMIQRETARLYKQAGVNPLAGCLPTLVTLPVWIGLYRALSNVANEGLLTEGFFWIPSLAGPTTISARQNGSGISWLFPFVDGHPPLGWQDTLAYLVLPVLLVVSQYVSTQIMQPPQANDPSQKNTQAILKFLPLMIGYFSLSVPSGLGLYWLTNNILSTTQQIWFRKWGSAKPVVGKDVDVIRSAPKAEVLSSQPITDTKTPRRGERFKQLKEEEARKKKEREEAARLAAAATASKAEENVVDHDRLHVIEGAKETQNASSLHGSDDEPNGDGDKTKEQISNSSTESTEPLEDIYAGNGNGATSDNQAPNTSEQSKQRGAS